MSINLITLLLLMALTFVLGVLSSLFYGYRAAETERQSAFAEEDMSILVTILERLVRASQKSQYGRLEYYEVCRAILRGNIGADTVLVGELDDEGELRIAEHLEAQGPAAMSFCDALDEKLVVRIDLEHHEKLFGKVLGEDGLALMLEDGNSRLYLLQSLAGMPAARQQIFILFMRGAIAITNASRQVARQRYASEKLSRELQIQILNLWRMVGGMHHNFRGIFSPGAVELQDLAKRQANGDMIALDAYKRVVGKIGPSIPILMQMTESMGKLQRLLRADHGPAMMEALDLRDLFLEHFSGWLERQAELKQGKLAFQESIPENMQILVDRTTFFQIVWNVLYNALKYTRTGSVGVSALEAEDQRIYLCIKDTGAGIAPEDLEKIGQYQFRSSETSDIPGHGVGLWFSRQLLESMGGELRISSKPGEGTLVEIGFQRAMLGKRRQRSVSVKQISAQ